MPDNDNSPTRLTVDSAASQIESLISPDFTITPDKEPAVKTPPKRAASKDDTNTESPSSQDTSEEPDEIEADASADTDDVDPDADNAQLEGDDEPDVEDEAGKEPPKFRVKVRGEEVEVTQDELLAGYSRQADYTRSKQELAAERAKFEKDELPTIRASAKKYAEGIAQIEDTLKAMQPAEPDWDTLANENPEDFARQRALWQLNQERLALVSAERQRAQKEVEQHQQDELRKTVSAENALLLEMVPEWKDNTVATKEKAEIANFAKEKYGFSDADFKYVVKASQMQLLRDAYLYSKIQAKKPAIQEKIDKVKSITPGPKSEQRPGQRAQERRQQRLSRTHSVEDAASVIANIPGLLDSIK